MKNYGIKVVESSKDISSTDVRDLILSSKYSMLKYHLDTTSDLTINVGDTHKYVDFTHNLGYVPAFIAYELWNGTEATIIPYGSLNEGGYPFLPTQYVYAYADSTKIRCGKVYTNPYGQKILLSQTGTDYWWDYGGGFNAIIEVGNNTVEGGSINSAIRFPSVPIIKNQSIVSASLDLAVDVKGSGTGDIKVKVLGIDEDNTGDFGSNPMGRTETTAVTLQQSPCPNVGEYLNINVKTQVEEITSRNGWSSGNAIGFKLFDNGSPDNVWLFEVLTMGIDSKLTIQTGTSEIYTFRVIVFKDKIA